MNPLSCITDSYFIHNEAKLLSASVVVVHQCRKKNKDTVLMKYFIQQKQNKTAASSRSDQTILSSEPQCSSRIRFTKIQFISIHHVPTYEYVCMYSSCRDSANIRRDQIRPASCIDGNTRCGYWSRDRSWNASRVPGKSVPEQMGKFSACKQRLRKKV